MGTGDAASDDLISRAQVLEPSIAATSAEEEAEGQDEYDRTDAFLADDEEEGGGEGSEDEGGAVKRKK